MPGLAPAGLRGDGATSSASCPGSGVPGSKCAIRCPTRAFRDPGVTSLGGFSAVLRRLAGVKARRFARVLFPSALAREHPPPPMPCLCRQGRRPAPTHLGPPGVRLCRGRIHPVGESTGQGLAHHRAARSGGRGRAAQGRKRERHALARSCGSRPMTSLGPSSAMELSVWRRSSSAIIGDHRRLRPDRRDDGHPHSVLAEHLVVLPGIPPDELPRRPMRRAAANGASLPSASTHGPSRGWCNPMSGRTGFLAPAIAKPVRSIADALPDLRSGGDFRMIGERRLRGGNQCPS